MWSRRALWLLCALAGGACGGTDKPPNAPFFEPETTDATTPDGAADGGGLCVADASFVPLDSPCIPGRGPSGSSGSGGGQGGGDAGGGACTGCGGGTSSPLPPATAAQLTRAQRTDMQCTTLAATAGFYTPASLYAIGGDIYVFSVDSSEAVPRVLMHRGALDTLTFAPADTLLYGARKVDLVDEGGTLRALVARQFYAVELSSTDGVTFEETQNVGPNEPTYNCEGYPPARYFRGRTPSELLAMGNDYNTGLFGCYERVFVGRRKDGAWSVPVEVGRGHVVFAFQGEKRAMIFTTLAVLESLDDGESWQAITGLDASGAAYTGRQLVLIRPHGTPVDGIAVAYSDDDGTSWARQQRLLPDLPYGDLLIGSDGENLAVAMATSSEIVLTASTDEGATWSVPTRLTRSATTRLLATAMSGSTLLFLTASDATSTLELCALR